MVVLLIFCALIVMPFISVAATSLAGTKQVEQAGGYVFWPLHPTLNAYRSVFQGGIATRAVIISISITTVGTALSLVTTVLLAYALSRPGSFGHRKILIVVILTLFFAPGIIPSFLIVKQLGLLNNYLSLILPVAVNAFNVVVMRAFFLELPGELLDSARMDGAGELGILWHVVLPLSKAVMAVIALFYAVGYWNAFFNALLYINSQSMWPLQLVLRTYVLSGFAVGGESGLVTPGTLPPPEQSLDAAILIVAVVPILVVYPFVQRYFIRGVLTGAIKG